MSGVILGTTYLTANFFSVYPYISFDLMNTSRGGSAAQSSTVGHHEPLSFKDYPRVFVGARFETIWAIQNIASSGTTTFPAAVGAISLGGVEYPVVKPTNAVGQSGKVTLKAADSNLAGASSDLASMVSDLQKDIRHSWKIDDANVVANPTPPTMLLSELPNAENILTDVYHNGIVKLNDPKGVYYRAYLAHQQRVTQDDVIHDEVKVREAYRTGSDSTYYEFGQDADVEWTRCGDSSEQIEVFVVLQDDGSVLLTDVVDDISSDGATFKARSEELSRELVDVAQARQAGEDIKVPDRDLRTEFSNYDQLVSSVAVKWLNEYEQAKAAVNSIALGEASAEQLADYEANKTEGESLADFISRVNGANPEIKPGTSVWTTVWDGLKGAVGSIGDYISKWPPATWLAGYAGYKTIQSATKSSIPLWLIVGGGFLLFTLVSK